MCPFVATEKVNLDHGSLSCFGDPCGLKYVFYCWMGFQTLNKHIKPGHQESKGELLICGDWTKIILSIQFAIFSQ